MASRMYGWESTFKTIQNNIKKKSDIIIAFIHWNLTRRGFLVIDTVEDNVLRGGEAEKASEVLPENWNTGVKYVLRYLYHDKLYILHSMETQDCLIVNLMKPESNTVYNLAVNPDTMVQQMEGSIDKMIPDYYQFNHTIKTNLIDPVAEKATNTKQTQTSNTSSERTPSVDSNIRPTLPSNTPWSPPDIIDNPRLIGSADLNPFAGGGGMLFDPFGPSGGRSLLEPGHGVPGGLPRGSVPPGARFDPFAPPGFGPMPNRRRPPPDADHFPPPGADNMFM